jgi:hypothetical protein
VDPIDVVDIEAELDNVAVIVTTDVWTVVSAVAIVSVVWLTVAGVDEMLLIVEEIPVTMLGVVTEMEGDAGSVDAAEPGVDIDVPGVLTVIEIPDVANVAETETGDDVALSDAENVDAAELDVGIDVPAVLIVVEISEVIAVAEIEVWVDDAGDIVDERSVVSAVVTGPVVLIIVVKVVEVPLAAAEVADAIVAVAIAMTVDVALSVAPDNAEDADTELPVVNVDISVAIVVPDSSGVEVRANVLKWLQLHWYRVYTELYTGELQPVSLHRELFVS